VWNNGGGDGCFLPSARAVTAVPGDGGCEIPMGYDCHITRADFWASSDDAPITADEWLAFVANDPELELMPENGKCFAEWTSPKAGPDGCWFDWHGGTIYTKWPTVAAMEKMLEIAAQFNASVQGDDGETYETASDWEAALGG